MSFTLIQQAVSKQFQSMRSGTLFQVAVDRDLLWTTYLASFPAGTDPIFKTRTEHDCNCCKHFIRTLGAVCAIVDNKLVTIWDFQIGGHYQVVADALAAEVRKHAISNLFIHYEGVVGTANSRQLMEDKSVQTWNHFFVNLPAGVVLHKDKIGPFKSEAQATHDVMKRSLAELSLDAVDTVLELISQNSLYRGEEHRNSLTEFRKLKVEFGKIKDDKSKDLFVWSKVKTVPGPISRIRNTSIGTLLINLSEGKELEDAVRMFEAVVAPTNYKRPTAIVTKAMIQKAQQTVDELGFTTALERRYATLSDITINNILFADRTTKKAMNVFEELSAETSVNTKKMDKVEEVPIENFITNILPAAKSLEVLLENRHASNMVSLIAPCDATAKNMFKWPNNFSWSYAGELTDSIKERVKAAGGSVTGDFRASLSWFNHDDLDLHLREPGGYEIYYGNRRSPNGGALDVDMNAGVGTTRTPVENIVYQHRRDMREGTYEIRVNNFHKRETTNVGFELEMEFDGTVYSFTHAAGLPTRDTVSVCTFTYSHKAGLEIVKSLPSSQSSKTVWGVPTQTFRKVNVVMHSPNYWDDKAVGNKHYMFMLDGCANEGKARGFFNEFLSESLAPHRKVLEVVGSKMKTDESTDQLSGIGFSSTQRNHLFCRVNGAFSRTVKITF